MSNILQAIADEVEALTDPHEHSEPRYDEQGKPAEPHKTIVPGLIEQLRTLAEPGNDGNSGSGGSRESVPVAIDAVSLIASIEYGSAKRLADAIERGARVERRQGAESCLRALVGIAARLPYNRTRAEPYRCRGCVHAGRRGDEIWLPCRACEPTVQTELLREVRSWRWQAEIITGWRTPPRELTAPCPGCESRGTLLAYADPDNPQAKCTECGLTWSQQPEDGGGDIGMLSRYVIEYGRQSAEANAAARSAAVAERRRVDGERPRDTPEVQPAAG